MNNMMHSIRHAFVSSLPLSYDTLGVQKRSCFLSKPSVPYTTAKRVRGTWNVVSMTGVPKTDMASAMTSFSWGVGQSRGETLVDAIPEAARKACSSFQIQGMVVTLALIFVHSTFESNAKDELHRVIPTLKRTLAMLHTLRTDTIFLGCTTGQDAKSNSNDGIISDQNKNEGVQVTVAVAHFPCGSNVSDVLNTVHFKDRDAFSLDWSQSEWHKALNLNGSFSDQQNSTKTDGKNNKDDEDKVLFVLYHPDFVDEARDLMSGLDFALPGVRKFGCAAGKVNALHEARLFSSNGEPVEGACVLCVRTKDVRIEVGVAQGARGVGPVCEVLGVKEDGSEITQIRELGTSGATTGAPMTLLDMWVRTDILSLEDGRLASKYLLFGTEVSAVSSVFTLPESKEKNDNNQKDIVLVSRKVTGFNEATKSIGVEGDPVRLGTRVQFQIRDEEGARAELSSLLDRASLQASARAADGYSLMGALLLVDIERGEALHGNVVPDLDVQMFKERFPVPLVVVTSTGQIGPLPSGGVLGSGVGDTFMLSASALYVSLYGKTGPRLEAEDKL